MREWLKPARYGERQPDHLWTWGIQVHELRCPVKRLALLFPLVFAFLIAFPLTTRAGSSLASKKPFPATVVDDLHVRVYIAHQPRRIVSLDPRDTETLFALGLEKRVVGDGGQNVEGAAGISRNFRYPQEWPSPWGRDYPINGKRIPHVEGGFGNTPFNLETVVGLHPDLVVSLKSDLPTLQKMRNLGMNVIVLDPGNIQAIFRDIALVGRATGASKQAARVVGTMRTQLDSVRARLANVRSLPTVYYEIDATNPTQPYTAGPGTFIDEAITLSKGKNVADGVTTPGCPGTGCYPQLNLEALVKLDPNIILLGDAAYGTTASSVRARSGWDTISAIRTGRIYPFDDELISRAGPRIIIGLQQLARRVHPEAFR